MDEGLAGAPTRNAIAWITRYAGAFMPNTGNFAGGLDCGANQRDFALVLICGAQSIVGAVQPLFEHA